MKAVFKPTNYTFELDDKYFVDVMYTDDTKQDCVAVFADLSDAVMYANLKVRGYMVRAVYVFSRTHQHHSVHASEAVPA